MLPRPLVPALLLALAVPLAGCPAPAFSALVKPDTELDARGRFVDVEAPCDLRTGTGACEPAAFQAVVDALAPDRIDGTLWSGETVRGRSLLLRPDTARIGGTPLPLADLRTIRLIDTPAPGDYLETLFEPTATAAGFGALAGLFPGGATVPEAAAISGGVGLALGLLARPRAIGRRVEVVGWAPPPRPDNRLDLAGDGCQTGPYPDRVSYWEPDCLRPAEVVERSTAAWVRQVDFVLRSGTRLEGRALSLGADGARLDGRPVAYDALARIELRHPRSALAPLATAAVGAREGVLMGGAVGAGFALADGDVGALWRGAAIGAGVLGVGGFVVGLLRPSDTARDVVVVPEP